MGSYSDIYLLDTYIFYKYTADTEDNTLEGVH